MRKLFILSLIAAVLLAGAHEAAAISYLYSFTSGDIADPRAGTPVTYGYGRIDFGGGKLPTVTPLSTSDLPLTIVGFKNKGKDYIAVNAQDESSFMAHFNVYDPARSVTDPIYPEVSVESRHSVSDDISWGPTDDEGAYFVIDTAATPNLVRYDMIPNWAQTASVQLPSGYDRYSIALDHNDHLYVWCSKFDKASVIEGGFYEPISSDIYIYSKKDLSQAASMQHPKTSFDPTLRRADDPPYDYEQGEGLTASEEDTTDKMVLLVTYDGPTSKDNASSIVLINQDTLEEEMLVASSDIGGWTVDCESPVLDGKGGFYFSCSSGDVTQGGESKAYHWTGAGEPLVVLDGIQNPSFTAEVADGEGGIFVSSYATSQDLGAVYLWPYGSDTVTKTVFSKSGYVEFEKPFPDDKGGFYFMLEKKRGVDEVDDLFYWDGDSPTSLDDAVFESSSELEIELPPKDGDGGFYFVDVIHAADVATGTNKVNLLHCLYDDGDPETELLREIGDFDLPPSVKEGVVSADEMEVAFSFLPVDEKNVLALGAGTCGGKNYKMSVFDWTDKKNPVWLKDFTEKDFGGSAELEGVVAFTEAADDSSNGCNSGLGALALLPLAGLPLLRRKRRK
ncbi:MAG: SYNERG-CTERM sorting domain-containing protein [Synergistes sp.]|nr:SYNERG-CTERM sorting domain-containing protein [Synergistes sp.]